MRILIEAANASVGVENAIIVEPTGTFDRVVRVDSGHVRPGLINAHDHLHRNHYGRLGKPPYANACDWARDVQDRHATEIASGRRLARREALLAGAWKNLRAGVTTVVHHDSWEADFDEDFPLRVVRVQSADSIGMGSDLEQLDTSRPYAIHVAEGVDGQAAEEVRQLDELGLLTRNLLLVHGVGVDPDSIRRIAAAGAALVWCPTSNLFMFGRTAPRELLQSGVDLLLGSDSLLTGAGDLLDEIRAARSLGMVDDARLEDSVGATAARRLGLAEPRLDPGCRADLVVLRKPLLESSAADVMLVMADGVLRFLHPSIG